MDELLTIGGAPEERSYSSLYECGTREEESGSPKDFSDRQACLRRATSASVGCLDYRTESATNRTGK